MKYIDYMSIEQFDNDFATYVADKETRKKLGQVFTPYPVIEKMMDKIDKEIWINEDKTALDPTMGAGNIIIAILYRRIVENNQNPIKAISNTYGIELDPKTHEYAKERIKKFMAHFTNEDLTKIIDHNFVCSDVFEWDIENWCSKNDKVELEGFFENA
ncbi:MAG: N-6 DNA methylase [Clostridia bacterium]|nr:N-6 DNA methylase [Clostridia bacterium]